MIDKFLVKESLGIDIDDYMLSLRFITLSQATDRDSISYIIGKQYLPVLKKNSLINVVFSVPDLVEDVKAIGKTPIEVSDPIYFFYALHNLIVENKSKKAKKTIIHPRARIHTSAYISEHDVEIDEDVCVMPNATILSGVTLSKGALIGSNSVIGSDGYEVKNTSMGIVNVAHDGYVFIGENVVVGANCCIDKGLFGMDTVIGNCVRLSNLVQVAHGVKIGSNTLIAGNALIGGGACVGKNVRVGPKALISNGIKVGDNVRVSLGAVVVKNVSQDEHVTGYFAVNHAEYLRTHAQRFF